MFKRLWGDGCNHQTQVWQLQHQHGIGGWKVQSMALLEAWLEAPLKAKRAGADGQTLHMTSTAVLELNQGT